MLEPITERKLKTIPYEFKCKKCGRSEHLEIVPLPNYNGGELFFDNLCLCGELYINLATKI